jgi:O-acetylhomoserine (thiol)-lyase
VEKVIYPELPDHPDYELAKKLLPHGCGAVFTFEIKGGRPAGKRFIESLRLFSHLANVGDAKSLVIHPASTTHYRMSDEDLRKAGITAGTVISIGLEDPQDLIEDPSARGSRPVANFASDLRARRQAGLRLHGGARARAGEAQRRVRSRRGAGSLLVRAAKPLLRLPRA